MMMLIFAWVLLALAWVFKNNIMCVAFRCKFKTQLFIKESAGNIKKSARDSVFTQLIRLALAQLASWLQLNKSASVRCRFYPSRPIVL